jgi:hypothetical protein
MQLTLSDHSIGSQLPLDGGRGLCPAGRDTTTRCCRRNQPPVAETLARRGFPRPGPKVGPPRATRFERELRPRAR